MVLISTTLLWAGIKCGVQGKSAGLKCGDFVAGQKCGVKYKVQCPKFPNPKVTQDVAQVSWA